MFRENKSHLQVSLFSTLDELPPAVRARLEGSWAGTFRREVFARIDERIFADLYSESKSRPNVAVNVLVGLEILKSGFGWSDEEMYEHFLFNVQVRYAVGYEQLGDGYFGLRSLYHFRRRLSQHMQASGENLLEQVFEQVTDEQMVALCVQSQQLRMDTTQVLSNIRHSSRLQLLVEVVQRVHRLLSERERQAWAEWCAPYVEAKASRYVYRLKPGSYPDQLAQMGEVMARLVEGLAAAYADEPVYQMLVRVFHEHYVWTESEQRPKQADELSASSLQSPDDWEATFRRKQSETYRGYVANVTETCDEENAVQLIVDVQVASNDTDDAELLVEAVPNLVKRTDVAELNTDGGFNSPKATETLEAHKIEHVQSAIRGGQPDPARIGLADFTITCEADGTPICLTCPQGQEIEVEVGRKPDRFIGRPDAQTCRDCPRFDQCRARPPRANASPVLYFTRRDVQMAQARQRTAAQASQDKQLRPAVEATVRSLKHPFRQGKLPVRGRFRVTGVLLCSALMVNVRRIHRSHVDQDPKGAVCALALLANTFKTGRRSLVRRLWDAWPFPFRHFYSVPVFTTQA